VQREPALLEVELPAQGEVLEDPQPPGVVGADACRGRPPLAALGGEDRDLLRQPARKVRPRGPREREHLTGQIGRGELRRRAGEERVNGPLLAGERLLDRGLEPRRGGGAPCCSACTWARSSAMSFGYSASLAATSSVFWVTFVRMFFVLFAYWRVL
jgi:hypothetical protein